VVVFIFETKLVKVLFDTIGHVLFVKVIGVHFSFKAVTSGLLVRQFFLKAVFLSDV
jgi:hypothetical protein